MLTVNDRNNILIIYVYSKKMCRFTLSSRILFYIKFSTLRLKNEVSFSCDFYPYQKIYTYISLDIMQIWCRNFE